MALLRESDSILQKRSYTSIWQQINCPISRQLLLNRYNAATPTIISLFMSNQDSRAPEQTQDQPAEKQESLLLNLACNLLVPTLILTKLSGDDYLGIKLAIVVALSFPIIYGLHDFFTRGKLNFFSALGVVSVTLTGGISLMELDAIYIAIKEASIPAMFGLATLLSLKTSQPLIHTFLLNESVMDTQKINQALVQHNRVREFDKLLINASWILAGSFFLSSVLNYLLAVVILTAEPGTVAFNEQLGKMTALSFPVIALPAMLVLTADLFYLFRGITKLTGMPLEEIVKQK
jgi:hypothetical protein